VRSLVFDLTTPPFMGDPTGQFFYEPFNCTGFGPPIVATPYNDPADVGKENIYCKAGDDLFGVTLINEYLRVDFTNVGMSLANKNLMRYRAGATSTATCLRIEIDGWTPDHGHNATTVLYGVFDSPLH
jgi:hypothetical protein